MIAAIVEWLGLRRENRQLSSRALIDNMKDQARKAEAETIAIRKRRAEEIEGVFFPQNTKGNGNATHTG